MSRRVFKRTYLVSGFEAEEYFICFNMGDIPDLIEYPYQMCVWLHMALASDLSRKITRSTRAISMETGIKEKDVISSVKALINKGYLSVVNE